MASSAEVVSKDTIINNKYSIVGHLDLKVFVNCFSTRLHQLIYWALSGRGTPLSLVPYILTYGLCHLINVHV